MSFTSIFLVALALAMDAFAVSITNGIMIKKLKYSHAVTFGLFFGLFQFIMPLLGYFGGKTFSDYITSFDHFIAFGLLAFIGGRMIYETFREDDGFTSKSDRDILSFRNLTMLAIATSIDAMAVGIGFAIVGVNILLASSIIGAVAFILSFFGVLLGKKVGGFFKTSAERLGGVILIIIGLKILIEHLMGQA